MTNINHPVTVTVGECIRSRPERSHLRSLKGQQPLNTRRAFSRQIMPGGYGAASSFPKTANSVNEWLAAIGMVRCQPTSRPNLLCACAAERLPCSQFLTPLVEVPIFFAQDRYASAFAEAGIGMKELREITDTKMRELVPTEGHKRRLVRGMPHTHTHTHTHTQVGSFQCMCAHFAGSYQWMCMHLAICSFDAVVVHADAGSC